MDNKKFQIGRNSNGRFSKGHNVPKELRKELSKKNLGVSRKHKEESKIKMSIIAKERFKNNPSLSQKRKEQTIRLMKEGKIKGFQKGDLNPSRTQEGRRKIKEFRKKQITPLKDTSIEVKIQNFLKELNIPFLTHQYMEIEHGYQCDILVPSINLVIECDGDWWHGNREKYPDLTYWQLEQVERDILRTEELKQSGFKILRLWEKDIKEMELYHFKYLLIKVGWLKG
jgi:G:T-mismatch repair DNA endonuclease (very short patch repair protein)